MEQLPQCPVHHRIGQMQGSLLGLLDMGFEGVAECGEFVDLGENSLPFLFGWNGDNYGANFSNTKVVSTQTTVFMY